jgi:hypothetical protein
VRDSFNPAILLVRVSANLANGSTRIDNRARRWARTQIARSVCGFEAEPTAADIEEDRIAGKATAVAAARLLASISQTG